MSFLFAFFFEKTRKRKRKKNSKTFFSLSLPRPARLRAHAKGSQLPTPQPVGAGPNIYQRGAGQQGSVPLHDGELAARHRVLELLPAPRPRRARLLQRCQQRRDPLDVDVRGPADPLVEVSGHHRADAVARVQLQQQAAVDPGVDQVAALDASGGRRDGGDEGRGNAGALPGVGVEPRWPGLDPL